MNKTTLQPLNDKIVILPDDDNKMTNTGLHIPDMTQGHKNKGEVIAVGPGKLLADGTRAVMQVKVGDKIWFNAVAGFKVTCDEIDYAVVGEEQVYVIE